MNDLIGNRMILKLYTVTHHHTHELHCQEAGLSRTDRVITKDSYHHRLRKKCATTLIPIDFPCLFFYA